MKQYLSVNLADRTASLVGGATWTPPDLTFGDDLVLALRFEKIIDGQTVETSENVAALWAAIGEIDAPPVQGKFAIKVGSGASTGANTTQEVNYDVSATGLQTALNALAATVATYGAVKTWKVDGSLLMRFGTGSVEVPLLVVDNTLWPISFGRISAYQLDGQWIHELRLQQAPGAFTDAAPRVLPPAPTVARVRAGEVVDDLIITEVQSLTLQREFRGTYDLTFGTVRTDLLSQEDGPEEVQAALQKLNAGFLVTLPISGTMNIEFAGDMAGNGYDLLEVNVRQAPEGDLTFTLTTRRAILAAMLRTQEEVTLPLHIRLNIVEDGEVKDVVALRRDVIIRRPLIWDDLATVQDIDWLQPPSPKDYIPFTLDQVITGTQHYTTTIGDGSATTFAIAHNLATESLHVNVRENVSGGRILRDNEFTAVNTSANVLMISGFATTPTAAQYAVVISSSGPISAFLAHTHTMGQIVGLLDYLSDLSGRVTTLEEILPSTGPAGTADTTGTGLEIELPEINTTLFYVAAPGDFDPAALPVRNMAYLLPAVHDSTVTTLPGTLPAPAAASVWQNTSGTAVLISSGGHIKSASVADQGYVGSDGRTLYEVVRSGTSNSFYAAAFERTLFTFEINDKMLRLNGLLDLQFSLVAQLLNAPCQAQWIVVIEVGSIDADTTPSPIGLNLKKITWSATPILSQVILLSPLAVKHTFGARIRRKLVSLVDTLTADRMRYGVWEGANDGKPATANFAIRARLTQFDTENVDATTLRGWVHYELSAAATAGGSKATATITY
ncbi:MAG: hypothetical protein ABIT76_08585 [Chthoniobacterales bacterium]